MSTVEAPSSNGNGTRLSDKEAREFAETIWAERNGNIKGAELGRLCGRTERWGSKQAARLRNAARSDTPVPTGTVTRSAGTAKTARARNGGTAHRNTRSRGSVAQRRVTALAVVLVAVVAAAASYSHMHALAVEAGEGAMARVLPLSVDGLVVAASMTLLSGRRRGVLPWLALFLGLGASLAANVAAAEPTVVGRMVAAWPPVALAMSFELLLRQTRSER